MKKRILRITILIAFITALVISKGGVSSLFKSPTAEAVGDLSVDWGVPEGNPIFVVTNMAPGESESRTVTVNNDSSQLRPVGVRGILTSETASMSGALSMTISEGGTDLYGGTTGSKTLAQFFADSAGPDGIFLSNLAGGNSTQYTFEVTFDPQSGNEFQNANVVFDLHIGISIPTPDECVNLNLNGDVIFGTARNDILRGTARGDLIFALEGNDIVQGRGGNDCIVGGTGRDSLDGEIGNDVILGQDGDDAILGHAGNDIMIGGNGNDAMHGYEGNDTMNGGAGDDAMYGAGGNDEMIGGDGRDAMYGENGQDTMFGNAGNDGLNGGNNNDFIDGGTGINAIFGGGGVDTCLNGTILGCEL